MSKRANVPLQRWAFDTEDDSKGNVYWINFFNGEEHVSFSEFPRAIEWLYEQRGEFWAVNLEYDLINVFNTLLDQMCVLTYGGFGLLKATLYGKPVKFYNTLRHWPMTVEEMGERLGYPKLPFDPMNLDYCKRDTEITWRFVGEMMKRYEMLGMEKIGATLPSTALAFYTSKFCQVRYEREDDLRIWNRLTQCRYGGRCEVFFTRPVESRVHEYDINSSYPFAMATRAFPDLGTLRLSVHDPDFENAGMIRATVKAPDMEFPVLPYRDEESGKLLFPIGTLTGSWTYPEFQLALEHGYKIIRIHDALEYKTQPSPFREYIDFLYSERMKVKDSDELMAYTLKIAMNSTFGKFGEEGELQVISRGNRHTMRQVPKHSNMIWAAYILAYGRMQLYRYIMEARAHGEVLYCDTDSVFVRAREKPFGDGSKELGQLSRKGTYHYAHFKLPKLYRTDDNYKAKGVPLDKRHHDMQHLKKEFFYDGIAEFMKPYRFLEARKLGEIANAWREVSKQVNAEYDKRQRLPHGRTWPKVVGESHPKGGFNKPRSRGKVAT